MKPPVNWLAIFHRAAAGFSLSSPKGGEGWGEEAVCFPTQVPSPLPSPRSGGERESIIAPEFPALLLAACFLTLAAPRAAAHGDLHERIAALTAQLHTNRTDPELWLRRADLQRQHGDFTAALADLDQAANLKPGWPATHLQRARISSDLENFPATINAATDCLKLAPANADARVLRARAQARLGKFAAAAADYDAVLNDTNSAPPLPDLYLERARAQAALGSLADALRGLDAAQQRFGETPSFALPAIEYERQRGGFEAALSRLERARNFFGPGDFLATRGEILLQAGRHAEAEQAFEAALASLDELARGRRALPQTADLEARLRAGLKQATVSTHHPHAP